MITNIDDISKYWHTVLDTLQEALLIVSPSGVVMFINRAAEEITGYKSEELVGQPCTVLECTGCKIVSKGEGTTWCELFVSGAVESKRCLVIGKARRQIHVLKRASVLEDENGQIIGAVEALTDITGMVQNEKEIVRLRRSLLREDGFQGLVGNSPAMRRIYSFIEDAARSDASVVISGESGTGKELVAQAIHNLGPRAEKPLIKVDCVTLNENVMESELFGHIKGAFTGADRSRLGRFELAEGGHVFLDEIGDVPLSIQAKLLRVLEEKVIERVGDHKPVKVDVRVITATNRDLPRMISEGGFREDLYYRINVIPIKMPPLRERREDIPLLARHFAERLAAKTGQDIQGLTPEAMSLLYRYTWPGNVRELKNAIEYAFVVCRGGWIEPRHLPESMTNIQDEVNESYLSNGEIDEREQLLEALRIARGNQSEAARILEVSRMTVWKRMKKYGLSVSRDIS